MYEKKTKTIKKITDEKVNTDYSELKSESNHDTYILVYIIANSYLYYYMLYYC